jgi:hypothetical protein
MLDLSACLGEEDQAQSRALWVNLGLIGILIPVCQVVDFVLAGSKALDP